MESSIAAFSNNWSIFVLFFSFQQFSNPSSSSAPVTWDLSINTWEQQIDLTFPVLLQVSGAIWIALFLTKKHACKEAPTTDVALDWAEESLNVCFISSCGRCLRDYVCACFQCIVYSAYGHGWWRYDCVNMYQVPQALVLCSEWLLTAEQMLISMLKSSKRGRVTGTGFRFRLKGAVFYKQQSCLCESSL